jgi:trk system potassium uptake protein TrkA
MGGSRTGLHIARNLEKSGREIKIFEWNAARCEELAAELVKTKVVCRDATSRLDLEQEHVARADLFVAATHDDERNIMGSVMAKEVGAKRALTVVHQPDFAPLLSKLGIDHAVTPRACFANRILRLVNRTEASSLAVMNDGQVEVLEFKVGPACSVINRRLLDVKFPKHTLIATILRGEEVIVPTGHDALIPGDSVVVIAGAESLDAVKRLFSE